MDSYNVHDVHRRGLSGWLLSYLAVLAVAGLVGGAFVGFGARGPLRAHVPAENAWPAHLVITFLVVPALAWLGLRQRHRLRTWLSTPVSAVTAHRMRVLLAAAVRGRPTAVLRLVLSLAPVALVSWCVFRAAFQITMGFDPNQVINAWGGPTYLGAMYCHYLDAAAMTVPALYLLHLLLPPIPRAALNPAPTGAHRSPGSA